ncbi:peptide ABC transporter substrate-binding protein SapA [Pseudomonas sp. FW306-02-F02-AA]|uniref:Peptide ABC transporter substrate-binding protein n=1 Tax=Pseudomonas fluorescens TaxID=294 RepID=A0A0N7GZJ5_PSEFL|nr:MULTISPECIES: ABC transporter substrate-binding protein [Pseudomonas]ALI00516.1 peptide ABC transporter substrate-binding protein [Pseudomonas fluorescens]PMZ03638.1 peptide ABC transporter substrate-binding protein SapA [Pseudomonas sp. FW306-02-F02-AB]PMZ09792.1 peptide ABC transporter substrate-binding protein SapA [Pseudomonas sp. FW306-02-H06C]PMZ16432.1 peptide ABC transporter substrate-binding protein SapA [Pseudomonas sp. FW306-02-F02-AA]PMZ22372.1 peptide ABC transporter substrate-
MKMLPLRAAIAAALLSVAIGASAKPLVVCTEASPEGFDMVQYTTAVTADAVAETIFNRLADFKPGTTEVIPALADSWDISEDGLTYTFHLRKGVKFHTTEYFKPTRDMNADDVVWSFQRQLDPNHPWHTKSSVGFPYFESMGFKELLKSVEKVDDNTVKFTLTRREAPFLADIAMAFSSIYSAEYADQLLKAGKTGDLNNKPVGTGPFIFQRYAKDAQVRFKANPEYFRGKPPADALILAIATDNNVRLQKLKANECQIALYPKPDDIQSIKADQNLKVDEIAAMTTSYTALNTTRKYMSDARVRHAINIAFDKEAYTDALYGKGNAVVGTGPYPPTLLGFNDTLTNPPRDLDKARALLKEAGVPEGTVFTLFTRNGGGPTNPNPMLGAQMMQSDLARIGIKVDIRVMEWGEMLKRAKNGEHDMVSAGWAGDNGDPDNFLTPNLSCEAAKNGENYARWCNRTFQDLIDKARAGTDSGERKKLYEQSQTVFDKEQPWIPMAYPKIFTAMRKNVEGFHQSPLTTNNFATTEVK